MNKVHVILFYVMKSDVASYTQGYIFHIHCSLVAIKTPEGGS